LSSAGGQGQFRKERTKEKHASEDVPWKVGAVVGVDDEVLLPIEKTLSNFNGIVSVFFQQSQELSATPCQQTR